MTTAQLAAATNLHRNTILRLVAQREISAVPVGGRHGFEFPDTAPDMVRRVLGMRHKERVELRRKNRANRRIGT